MGKSSNSGRVFVVQKPRPKSDGWTPNLETATQYGRIEFVFDLADRAYADPSAAATKVASKLADFNPEKDFICWTSFGDPACLWIAIMYLARRYSKLRFLYWSRGRKDGAMRNENGFYFPLELNVGQISGG
jgi:hypothetical protein